MPNGVDKNWYRMCSAINGFRARYGSWPTKIRLPEGAIDYLFTEETFEKLEEKLAFVYDDSTYIAEDSTGRRYNLGQEGFSDEPPDIPAREWLKVEPDSNMVKEYYTPHSNVKDNKKENRKRLSCLSVLESELVLLIMVIIILLVIAAKDYDGTCISWEPPIPSCSMGEYLRQVALLMPISLIVLSMQYWWIAAPLIILFPILWNLVWTRMARRSKIDAIDMFNR